jgi:hypothetical protein
LSALRAGHALPNRILDEIEAGLSNGSRYSDAARAEERAAWRIMLRHAPETTEEQAKEVIKTLPKIGTL